MSYKPLSKLDKRQRKNIKISKVRNKKRDMKTHSEKIW